MGKITVKHYLEKRINPENNNGLLYYPVYNQITINRKTTQLKSISLVRMTETEFEKYASNVDYKADFINRGLLNKVYFEKEPERIRKSFEIIQNDLKTNDLDKKLTKIILSYIENIYMQYSKNSLIELCWNYQICQKGKQYIYQSFNTGNTLIKNIESIKKYFGVNLTEKIPIEDYIFWNNINNLLLSLGNESIFIDFVANYQNEINKAKGIKDIDKFTNQIEEIIKFAEYTN